VDKLKEKGNKKRFSQMRRSKVNLDQGWITGSEKVKLLFKVVGREQVQ